MRDARVGMHAGIATWRFAFESVAGKAFPAFPAHVQPAIYVYVKSPCGVPLILLKCFEIC